MTEEKTLDEAEQEVRAETRAREAPTLRAIDQMINIYLTGFGEIKTFTQTEDNKLEQVWFFLTVRSFKFLRSAYRLLETGYYGQCLTLSRSAAEDWLFCIDAIEHEETVDYLIDQKGRRPNMASLAARLEPHLRDGWLGENGEGGSYHLLSRFAHPTYVGMASLVQQGSGQITVGPFFDETMFLVASNDLILRLLRTTEFLARLVAQNSQWLEDTPQTLDEVNKVHDQNAVRMERLHQAT